MPSSALFPRKPVKRGFTLVEILVALAIVALLAAILLPVAGSARRSAENVGCLENLRQIGIGIQNYATDHDGLLPGPAYSGIIPTNLSIYLPYFLAPYMGYPVTEKDGSCPPPQTYAAMLCPGYRRAVPPSLWAQGFSYQAVYALSSTNGVLLKDAAGNVVSPWGHLGQGVNSTALRLLTLGTLVQPSKTWAIEDADLVSYATPTLPGMAKTPVHGKHWNKLYFDWHVDSSADYASGP